MGVKRESVKENLFLIGILVSLAILTLIILLPEDTSAFAGGDGEEVLAGVINERAWV